MGESIESPSIGDRQDPAVMIRPEIDHESPKRCPELSGVVREGQRYAPR